MEIKTIECLPKEDCTGCGACVNRCPAGCISMERDEEGFLYPAVCHDKCLSCFACKAVCPVLSPPESPDSGEQPDCYAAWSSDPEIRFQSTSGGVFSHLAQAVLEGGGAVAGAAYRGDHLAEHRMIAAADEIGALRQSKYLQSETGFIYRAAEERLQTGQTVLFTGTPCQCAGLRAYLGKEYENLLLCGFICRGVNSPMVYLAYLRELERQYASPIKQVWFKNKTHGWNQFCTKVVFEDGQEYLAGRETDPFMLGYIKSRLSLYMRPSCYRCRFKGWDRSADITLGDFWGIERQNPEIDSKDGVSLVVVHSPKGRRLWSALGDAVYSERRSLSEALSDNACFYDSVKPAPLREAFFRGLSQDGFRTTIENLYLSKE